MEIRRGPAAVAIKSDSTVRKGGDKLLAASVGCRRRKKAWPQEEKPEREESRVPTAGARRGGEES